MNGKPGGWTSLNTTHVTVAQLLTAQLDSHTALPPALAGDPKIKAKITGTSD
ncbi:hypothetical protein [Streptomyces katrae]|uniref:hypothetical protein n=1 Tax=Streptomyces katrae TaxID=68223 RepID=UPI000AF177AE|nr:hypothetical protein [Streptomyces katrae]